MSNLISQLGNYIIPAILLSITIIAFLRGSDGFEDFCTGAKEGLKTCISLAPTLIGLLMATSVLRLSGFLDAAADLLAPLAALLHFPKELISLAIIKIFSSSAAASLLIDIYKQYGTDSHIGFLASVMLSSTETVMYLMTVYFAAAKTKYSRYTLPGALLTTIAGIIISTLICAH